MLLQTSIYLILATHLTIIQSQSTQITCTNPNGCIWYCSKSNPCTNSTYNCTSIASSCTLNCLSCNGTEIITSSNDFNLICIGIHGCTNIGFTPQTDQNHIHMSYELEPTMSPTYNPTLEPTLEPTMSPTISLNPTLEPTMSPTINQSIIPIHQYTTNKPTKSPFTTTINQIDGTIFDGEIAVDIHENNENIDAIGGLLTFAGILTGMFCFCICIGICFVCHTKRKSKLRKNTHNDEYETVNVEYDKEHTTTKSTHLSKEDKIIQELEEKISKRLIINNQTLTHINTNISNGDIIMDQLQINKTITPFSGNGNDEYDNDNKLIKQITPRIIIGPTISSYNENKKLNDTDSSETEINDDSIDMNDVTFNPGEIMIERGQNKGRHYKKIDTLTNNISINIESVRDDMDDDDSECQDALSMKPETSASVHDLVAMYNKL